MKQASQELNQPEHVILTSKHLVGTSLMFVTPENLGILALYIHPIFQRSSCANLLHYVGKIKGIKKEGREEEKIKGGED